VAWAKAETATERRVATESGGLKTSREEAEQAGVRKDDGERRRFLSGSLKESPSL
jgi:hypothetical protein